MTELALCPWCGIPVVEHAQEDPARVVNGVGEVLATLPGAYVCEDAPPFAGVLQT